MPTDIKRSARAPSRRSPLLATAACLAIAFIAVVGTSEAAIVGVLMVSGWAPSRARECDEARARSKEPGR